MSNVDRTKIIAVVGPTASGKTSLGVFLAEKLSGEIISADSMQIYKGMDIATAKPSIEEMREIKHHLIDFLALNERFSVAEFNRLASDAVSDILSRGKFPIIVGGTGLYIDSFLSGIRFLKFTRDESLKELLEKKLETEGAGALLKELSGIDPETAASLHQNNTKKIIRALELYMATGKTISQQNALSRKLPSNFDSLYIGLNFKDRSLLYRRINQRVDEMLEKGLLKEAKAYYAKPKSDTSAAAIGYKELKPYLDKEKSLTECVDSLKTATRHYAKRQITWFKKNENIKWFYVDDYRDFSELANEAYETARKWIDEEK